MNESSRQSLWLAAWVMGFAVAMSCLLIAFKHRAAIDALQRERLQLVATAIGDVIEGGGVPELLEAQKRSDALIEGIDVVDAKGLILHSTDASRRGRRLEQAWRMAMQRAKAGNVVVRYRLERWDAASAGFARHLVTWGAVIAVLGTLTLFFMLRYLNTRLEERLERIRQALARRSDLMYRQGSLRADAAAARAKIDEAERLLHEAHEALVMREAKR